jgi:hypothetical protein
MRDWLGRAWDFLMQTAGSLIARQRWTDYKRWTDFGGSWLPKVEYKLVDLNEGIKNPSYKFFWWWLRYAVFIIGKVVGRIKAFGVAGVKGVYRLNISGVVRCLGSYVVRGVYKLSVLGNCKVQGVVSSWFKYWLYPLGVFRILGQASAIIGIPLRVLELVKVLGICDLVMRIFVGGAGNIKVQSSLCVSQYVSWQHFGTWQDWANATNGKWYYKC